MISVPPDMYTRLVASRRNVPLTMFVYFILGLWQFAVPQYYLLVGATITVNTCIFPFESTPCTPSRVKSYLVRLLPTLYL